MRPVGVAKKQKKRTETFMRQTGYLPDHPRRRRPLKVCMRSHVWEVVIYFKFHENRSRGLRAVKGRKSPIDLAHGLYNSLYYRTSRDSYKPRFVRMLSVRSPYFFLNYHTTCILICLIEVPVLRFSKSHFIGCLLQNYPRRWFHE